MTKNPILLNTDQGNGIDDALAAACIFHPDICAYEKGNVAINPERGQTTFEPGLGSDKIASTVNADHFFEEFFSVLTRWAQANRRSLLWR